MHWNHRIIEPDADDNDIYFEIVECFYNENNEPTGYAEATVIGETVEELKQYVEWMAQALSKPVLKRSDFARHNFEE